MNSFEVNSEGEEEDGNEDEVEDDYTEDSAGSDGTNKSDSGSDFENNTILTYWKMSCLMLLVMMRKVLLIQIHPA